MNQNTLIPIGSSFVLESEFLQIGVVDDLSVKEVSDENSFFLLSQKLVEYLENIYIFKNPLEIKKFLICNKDLIEIIFSAPEYIHKIFGDVPIYLELHHDPEEEWDELFIVIKSDYPPKKAVELEEKLFKDWFVKVLNRVKGRLNFTEEPL